MIGAVIAGTIAFIVVAVVLARQSSGRKKMAIESLKAEKQLVGHYDILEMVNDEVNDLGLRSIAGSERLGPDLLLRAWKDAAENVRTADHAGLRFVVTDGVDPSDASHDDVTLVIDGAETVAEPPDDLPDDAEEDEAPS